MNKKGKLIRYFLKDGEYNGLKTLEIANKTILCTIIPRASITKYLKDIKEKNISNAGVYILTDTPYLENRKIYIGEGDPVEDRIRSHYQEKSFWDECIIFTSKDSYLTKTQVQYLESKLIEKGKKYKRIHIEQNNSKEPNISDVERSEIEDFLEDLFLILESLQYNMFIKTEHNIEDNVDIKDDIIYTFNRKSAESKMKIKNNKYILLKGSTIVKNIENVKSTRSSTIEIRKRYIESGALKEQGDNYILTEDIDEFTSPSGAAIFVAGGSLNGSKEWKYNGKTLGDIEKEYINN